MALTDEDLKKAAEVQRQGEIANGRIGEILTEINERQPKGANSPAPRFGRR